MTSINNVQPLSAQDLFDLIKTEFSSYLNEQLGSNLTVEAAHVSDIINISFPEVIEGNAFTLTISDDSIDITDHTTDGTYNSEMLLQHLISFLKQKAS